jgi:ring-1,2-phenylacetyl-CoA epoxidase subunit PaaE
MALTWMASGPLAQLGRDLRHLRLRLGGGHPSPLVARPRSPRAAAGASSVPAVHAAPRELVVARVVRETKDVVTLVLVDEAGARFDFLPGQFFTVLARIDGADVSRNYSASNAPGTAELHLTIKRREGGRASGVLVSSRAGDRLRVRGPFGSFTVTPSSAERRAFVLVAGGVGITPLLSIARAVLAAEPASRLALVYGNRTRDDVAFASEIDALARAHGDRFVVRHVLESPHAGFEALAGRLDRVTFARIAADLGLASPTFYVCGPDAMRDEVLAALGDAPVRTERFAVGSQARAASGAAHAITIRAGGREHVTVAAAGATLLEAGLAAGAPMPSSCSAGGCGACRIKLVSGEVELAEPHCLTPAELRSGFVLACVGRAKTPCTLLVEGGDGGEQGGVGNGGDRDGERPT